MFSYLPLLNMYRVYLEAYGGNATLENYISPGGTDTIAEFLAELPSKSYAKTIQNLNKLRALGAGARPPLSKPIRDGIFELRTTANEGGQNYYIRIFYFWKKDNTAVLVHGINKKTDKTPPSEIDIAINRMKEYLSRGEKNGRH